MELQMNRTEQVPLRPGQSLEVGFSQGALVPPSREGAIEAKIWIL